MSRDGMGDRHTGRRTARPGGTRGTGRILRERAPRQRRRRGHASATWTEHGADGDGVHALPSWGRRLLGALLLIGTVTLVSCQGLFTAIAPELYR